MLGHSIFKLYRCYKKSGVTLGNFFRSFWLMTLLVVLFLAAHPTRSIYASDLLVGSVHTTGTGGLDTNDVGCTKYTATVSGSLTELHYYMNINGNADIGVYSDVSSLPDTRLTHVVTSAGATYNISSVPSISVTSGTNYWLCLVSTDGGTLSLYNESGVVRAYIGMGTLPTTLADSPTTTNGYTMTIAGYGTMAIPTGTPTPTPLPIDVNVLNFPVTPTPNPFNYNVNTQNFIPLDYLQQGNNWHQAAFSLGLPDSNVATISATGFYPLLADFEVNDRVYTGTYSAIKIDVIGKNFANVAVYPQHNHANISSCNGKLLESSEEAIGHHYATWTFAECNINTAWISDHTLGIKLQYWTGVVPVVATVDSIEYIPIFTGSSYDTDVINVTPIRDSTSISEIPHETCAAGDILCNMRNWVVDKLTFIFGINTEQIAGQYHDLIVETYSKSPWGYIYAIQTANYNDPELVPFGFGIPDFTIATISANVVDVQHHITTTRTVFPQYTIMGTQFEGFQPAVNFIRAGIKALLLGSLVIELAYLLMSQL